MSEIFGQAQRRHHAHIRVESAVVDGVLTCATLNGQEFPSASYSQLQGLTDAGVLHFDPVAGITTAAVSMSVDSDSVINNSSIPEYNVTDALERLNNDITDHSNFLVTLESNLDTAITDITALDSRATSLEGGVGVNATAISDLQSDFQVSELLSQNAISNHNLEYQALDGQVEIIDARLTAVESIDHSIANLVDTTITTPSVGEVLHYNGAEFVNSLLDAANVIDTRDTPQTLDVTLDYLEQLPISIAEGYNLGFAQSILAETGQVAKSVLAVGNTTTGKVQGVSLGDGNVIEVYASGADFNAGQVLYREFMCLGEPICFTGLANGAIITSIEGFYGFSEQISDVHESPMPLLNYALSFKETLLFGYRSFEAGSGKIIVVNGPVKNLISLTDGNGVVVSGQSDIELQAWEYVLLSSDGDKEYILKGTQPMMACLYSGEAQDSRLILPLTNDGITYNRGHCSAIYDNTGVDYYFRDGVEGSFVSSPGSPVNIMTETGSTATKMDPNSAIRFKAKGLISSYTGADGFGNCACPMLATKHMTQLIAQPLHIDNSGHGGLGSIAIASPYVGTAKVYEWDDVLKVCSLKYTMPLTRNGVTVVSKEDQLHPASSTLLGSALTAPLGPGYITADVPINVIVQNGLDTLTPSIRSQTGTVTTSIINEGDESLSLGITPETIKCDIREGSDGVLYKRVIGASCGWIEA